MNKVFVGLFEVGFGTESTDRPEGSFGAMIRCYASRKDCEIAVRDILYCFNSNNYILVAIHCFLQMTTLIGSTPIILTDLNV